MADYIIKYVVAALLLYALIPTLLARLCNLGAISRLPASRGVCITFDDGPDPRYTPRVLDILKEAGVKACFFVVGEKARQYPDLIKKIVTDGHEIGSHGFRHKNPWLLGPVGTVREIRKSFQAIEEISGFTPGAFRPPWGLFNLSHLVARLLMGYKIVLWSFMSWDWTRGSTPEEITENVRKKMMDGSILVFHDSDTEPGASEGSPDKMLNALPDILSEIKKRGYRAVPLRDFINTKKALLNQLLLIPWRVWDSLFRLALRVHDVTDDNGNLTIFRIAARRYPGPRARLHCGNILSPGVKICEIHLNSDYIRKLLAGETRAVSIGVKIAGELRRSLPALAKRICRDRRFEETEFLVGITLLHRGAVTAGFDLVDIPFPYTRRLITAYQGLILRLYHPSGQGRLYGKGGMDPKILAMSKKTLLSRYLKAGPA